MRARHGTAGGTGEEPPALDETAYYHELRESLIAAQSIDETALRALGEDRAEQIRELLVDEIGIDAARVRILDPIAVESSGDGWVRLELDVTAGD